MSRGAKTSSYPTATLDANHQPTPNVLGQGMTLAMATAFADGYGVYSASLMTLAVAVAGRAVTAQVVNVKSPLPVGVSLAIAWGDGSLEQMGLSGTDPTQSLPTTHTYTTDGVFQVQVSADAQRAMAEVRVNWPSPTP